MDIKEYIELNLCHSLHTSERRSFRSCRRRWNWVHRELYYPKVEAKALEFGVAFHRAMEVFYEPSLWAKPDHFLIGQGLALVAFRDKCNEQLKKYKKLNGEPSTEVLDDYKERLDLGLNMIKYYTEHVSPIFDKDFTPVEVEVPFEVPITGPNGEMIWCKCDRCWKKYTNSNLCNPTWIDSKEVRDSWVGLPVTYGGRLDVLVQDSIGRYWIVDWKSTARILDEDAESSFLQLDDQIASYIWALRWYGIEVAGFIYVEIKKTYPKPPEELSRLYKGKRFSTNKQNHTTYEMFRDTVLVHDPEAAFDGLYDEHLNWLKNEGPKFHQRHQIHKNQHEIDAVGNDIWLEAQDMIDNPRVYPQPGRFSCTTCLFKQPCLGVNLGEDWQYTLNTLFEKRDRPYWDIQEVSTD